MARVSTTTYALLGMLATRSWTGYELTGQLQRSLRFVWSSSEGHLYREQKRLVELGWATVEKESSGRRRRNRYTITAEGKVALRNWLATEPNEPNFDIEGLLRVFYASEATTGDLVTALDATASSSRRMLHQLVSYVEEYLEEGGPLWMLEHGIGGPEEDRLEFHGRTMLPERLHVISLVQEAVTGLLADLADFASQTGDQVRSWPSTTDPSLTPETRERLEGIRDRYSSETAKQEAK